MYRIALLGILLVVISPLLLYFSGGLGVGLDPLGGETPPDLGNDPSFPSDGFQEINNPAPVSPVGYALERLAVFTPILGFIATAMGVVLGWRKDRREVLRAELENKELRLRIQRLETGS